MTPDTTTDPSSGTAITRRHEDRTLRIDNTKDVEVVVVCVLEHLDECPAGVVVDAQFMRRDADTPDGRVWVRLCLVTAAGRDMGSVAYSIAHGRDADLLMKTLGDLLKHAGLRLLGEASPAFISFEEPDRWGGDFDGDSFRERYASRDDAAAEAYYEACAGVEDPPETIEVTTCAVTRLKPADHAGSFDDWADQLIYQSGEECGLETGADEPVVEATAEERADLAGRLEAAWRAWCGKHAITSTRWRADAVQTHTVTRGRIVATREGG